MTVYTVAFWKGTTVPKACVYSDRAVAIGKAVQWTREDPRNLGAVVQQHELDSDRGGETIWKHTVCTADGESSYWQGQS